jgi:hypothetical protein
MSGNQVFVPYLKAQLRNPHEKLHKEASLLQVGLAKAGQGEQIQQIYCELNFGDASMRCNALHKLESVRGWIAIHNTADFLKDDRRYTSVFGGGPAVGRVAPMSFQELISLCSENNRDGVPTIRPNRP